MRILNLNTCWVTYMDSCASRYIYTTTGLLLFCKENVIFLLLKQVCFYSGNKFDYYNPKLLLRLCFFTEKQGYLWRETWVLNAGAPQSCCCMCSLCSKSERGSTSEQDFNQLSLTWERKKEGDTNQLDRNAPGGSASEIIPDCGGLTLARCQVPTKATLAPLLSWTAGRK